MSLPTEKLLGTVAKMPAIKKIKLTVATSLKCGAMVGSVTAISGILGGPIGLALGGLVSSGIAAYMNSGDLTSVPYILLYETTNEEKEELGRLLRSCLNSHHIHYMYEFIDAIGNNRTIEAAVVEVVTTFLSAQLGHKLLT